MNELVHHRSRTKVYFTINQINKSTKEQINQSKVETMILTALTSLLRQIWGKKGQVINVNSVIITIIDFSPK